MHSLGNGCGVSFLGKDLGGGDFIDQMLGIMYTILCKNMLELGKFICLLIEKNAQKSDYMIY